MRLMYALSADAEHCGDLGDADEVVSHTTASLDSSV